MSTIIAKMGSTVVEKHNIPAKEVQKQMDSLLKEHPHICGSCKSDACRHNYSLRNDIVVRGLQAGRLYIFECLGYRKGPLSSLMTDGSYTPAETVKKYGSAVSATLLIDSEEQPTASFEADVDDYVEQVLAVQDFEETYGDLLEDFSEPVFYCKRKKNR